MKKLLVLTGGGDCPGLNAVIRAIVKSASQEGEWEVYGSKEAFNGVISDPPEIIKLTSKEVGGIHVKGGTILKTTNKGNPLAFPVKNTDGSITMKDVSATLVEKVKQLDFDAVINIGGDGSQKISQGLFEQGLNIVGVPKTIDNDLSATDLTFGFTTAVQIASDAFDKLVTTASSHHRVMILEVMGRDAGWIALHTAISGGAEICLIPEIPFKLDEVLERINERYDNGKGFVNIVIAEGARAVNQEQTGQSDKYSEQIKLGGVGNTLRRQLEDIGCEPEIRVAILGHIQRGGTPMAFDRILATAMGKASYDLVKNGDFGRMVCLKNNKISSASLKEATEDYNYVDLDHYLVQTARAIGISFGD